MKISIGYCGQKDREVDHMYGTDLVWEPGVVHQVDEKVAALLLRHDDVWYDARTEKERASHAIPIAERGLDGVFKYRDADVEIDREQPMFNIETAESKEALVEFAQKTFNMELDKRMSLDNLKAKVRSHMQREALGA